MFKFGNMSLPEPQRWFNSEVRGCSPPKEKKKGMNKIKEKIEEFV
jgi:hypothetical protein